MDAGPKAVTSKMLAAHPSHGAEVMQPSAARDDQRPYNRGVQYFPDAPDPRNGQAPERAKLPPRSLFQNPWLNNYDVDEGDIITELRGTVRESNRFYTADVSARMAGRTFEHQWIPPEVTKSIVGQKIDASELLRPAQDDYRRDFRKV